MDVLVERYQRRKYVNQEDAPLLYYIRQKSGNVRVMDVDTMATAIESKSSLTAGDVKPKINHGDIIALHQCTLNDIQYGEIYAVVLDTIRTIKILRRSPDPDKLRFIPINTNDYDEQEFDKSRIINVFEVIGSISKFF